MILTNVSDFLGLKTFQHLKPSGDCSLFFYNKTTRCQYQNNTQASGQERGGCSKEISPPNDKHKTDIENKGKVVLV